MNFPKRAWTKLRWFLRKQIKTIRQAKEILREMKRSREMPSEKKLCRLLIRICELLSLIRLILRLLRENWKGSGRN